MKQLEDFSASLGYLVMLDDINHVSSAKLYMTSETKADYDLFVKSQFDKDLEKKYVQSVWRVFGAKIFVPKR